MLIPELPNESHNPDQKTCDDAKTDCNHDFPSGAGSGSFPKKIDLTEKGV